MKKICAFNVLNLFLNIDKYNGEDITTITEEEWKKFSPSFGDIPRNKSLYELTELAKAIKDIDADVYVLPEVGGYNSLKSFNELFLDSHYKVILNEENSRRGIFVGFLIKPNLSCKIKSFSFEKIINKNEVHYFSRNLNLLSIIEDEKCLFHVMGVHLKSPRKSDLDGKDIDSIETRKAEFGKLIEIYQSIENDVEEPIFLAGDFNFDVMSFPAKPEAEALISTDLIDIHSLKNSTDKDRATFVYFQTMGNMVIPQQIDFILFNKKFSDRVDVKNSGTYFYKNDYGDSLGFPSSIAEKKLQPSDHFPLVLKLK